MSVSHKSKRLQTYIQHIKELNYYHGKVIHFSDSFNHSLTKNTLSPNIKKVKFGAAFNQSLGKDILPQDMTYLKLGIAFKQPFDHVVLPPNLRILEVTSIYKSNYIQTSEYWKQSTKDTSYDIIVTGMYVIL